MAKFKVRDRVQVHGSYTTHHGKTGFVVAVNQTSVEQEYSVYIDSPGVIYDYLERNLRSIEEDNVNATAVKQDLRPTQSFYPREPTLKRKLYHGDGVDADLYSDVTTEVNGLDKANLISSEYDFPELADSSAPPLVAPIFDFDFPIQIVESSTPDHWHLYIDKVITFDNYIGILESFVKAGLVEAGWLESAKAKGFAAVRPPGVVKPVIEPIKVKPGHVLVLRTSKKDLTAHARFQWPVLGDVAAPDWIDNGNCGNGLHGYVWGSGFNLMYPNGAFQVVEVLESDIRQITEVFGDDEKVKFPKGRVVYTGNHREAAKIINDNLPAGKVKIDPDELKESYT